jgi:hypothetical protein
MSDERARRLALNEALIRDVNEAVGGLAQGWFTTDEPVEFRCECVKAECETTLSLTLAQYARVRAAATRFIVAPGHEEPTVEIVVDDLNGVRVVEKTGAGRRVAEETDPRRRAN